MHETMADDLTTRIIADGNRAMDSMLVNIAKKVEHNQRLSEHTSRVTEALLRMIPKEDLSLANSLNVHLPREKHTTTRNLALSESDSLTVKAHVLRPFVPIRDAPFQIIHEDTNRRVVGPPYLGTWRHSHFSGGASAHTNADSRDGSFGFELGANGGAAYGAAGIWIQFNPTPPLPRMIQVRPFCPYDSQWHDVSSNGYIAHTHGGFGIVVCSFDLNGNDRRVVQNFKYYAWNDGTGWFEEHISPDFDSPGVEHAFYLNYPNYFTAQPYRLYTACIWCFASNDAGSGFFGNAFSDSAVNAWLDWVVIGEQ